MEKFSGEFFITLDGKIYLNIGPRVINITEEDSDIYNNELEYVKSRHYEAYQSLERQYGGMYNCRWMMFKRWANCNYALMDHIPDVDATGLRHLEKLPCPARFGMDCPDNNCICNPKFTTNLTKREEEVMALIIQLYSDREIADRLYLNIETIKSHRRNILDKLNLKNKAEIIDFAHKNEMK